MAVRWGDGRRADSDFAREQILDAAWRCYQTNSIYKTSMEHIAREAKVSRTTIYRYFENRDEVLTGVIVRALHTLVNEVREHVSETATFAEFLVEALATATEAAPRSPVFSVLLQEQNAVMSRIYIGSADIIGIVNEFFLERFERAHRAGELRDGIEFPQLVDWLIHVLTAYVLAPSPLRGSSEWRQMLYRFLVPSIVRETER